MDNKTKEIITDRFLIRYTSLAGLICIERNPLMDARGYFERLFCEKELETILAKRRIVQINHTFTAKKGSIRGLHFQYPPYAEMKFVTCIKGEVFDIAVDIRKGSPTFLKWHGEILTQDNFKTLIIPEGFAHGFQTLQDGTEIIYFVSSFYNPSAEGGLNPFDPKISIKWPTEVREVSDKDSKWPLIDDSFKGIEMAI
ncbi:MAG: dTDP-4-dehydrorhamnose 3,5-epimerase [candidate division WOR-3 bacterium]